ncbi:MAG: type II toxin-antitoxin system PemK/MazF family toxin [Chloroflexi bacterium]|nr:type II toxin-antitoxin system PemK/MazF family toxin [Chloroflexota bacterium]MBI3760578.1 type II toxin-antitoxin system PemK/MazF family toxin [Chloroflexota bacterium]
MKRGDVYDARLDPTEGSEQAGTRPVVIVSRDVINDASTVVIVVPLTNAANLKRAYPHDGEPPIGVIQTLNIVNLADLSRGNTRQTRAEIDTSARSC